MSRWHNYYPDEHAFFCAVTVTDWQPALVGDARRVLYEEWEAARRVLGVRILAYCVMPNHVHLLLWSERGTAVRDFLHRVASCISRVLSPGGGFWKERPRVLPIYSRQVLLTKMDYLHANPVRAGLVPEPGDWLHSSFRQIVLGIEPDGLVCDNLGEIVL